MARGDVESGLGTVRESVSRDSANGSDLAMFASSMARRLALASFGDWRVSVSLAYSDAE